jgi:hypothetical protein
MLPWLLLSKQLLMQQLLLLPLPLMIAPALLLTLQTYNGVLQHVLTMNHGSPAAVQDSAQSQPQPMQVSQ